jgi:prevent-host-death family protein
MGTVDFFSRGLSVHGSASRSRLTVTAPAEKLRSTEIGSATWPYVAICATVARMDSSISVRDLRNTVSAVLRRVEGGERLTITVDRRPVAEIVPLHRRRTVPAAEALAIVSRHAADRGLVRDVRGLLADTTDDL